MLFGSVIVGLLPLLASAVPAPGLRLVKTSEDGSAIWVPEKDLFSRFTARRQHYVDITNTPELEDFASMQRAAAPVYPSSPSHQSEANALIPNLKQSNLQSWLTTLANFYNRYYKSSYGTQAATWMFNTVKSAAAANPKIQVTQFVHAGYNQPSVIAKIPGTSSAVAIVSAHFDSIGSTTSGRAPGADDNASGVVAILEPLRVLANAKWAPKNTLEFHFYSGEEGGLRGSRDIMSRYQSTGVNVLAVVNQDMTGYSPNNVIAVYTDYVSTPLTEFVSKLVPVYTKLPVVHDKCGYGCSDHASATSAGFPAAYVCDENMKDSSPYIHSAQDTVSTVSFAHVLEHAKFTLGFLVEGSYF